jgi:hypothetical protein
MLEPVQARILPSSAAKPGKQLGVLPAAARSAFRSKMCFKTTCVVCKLPTWTGCGQHVASALRGIPEENRCPVWKTGAGSHKLAEGETTEAQAGAAAKQAQQCDIS